MDWTTVRHIALWTAGLITGALALWLLLGDPIHKLHLGIYYWLH
jgi:hypothetical protein